MLRKADSSAAGKLNTTAARKSPKIFIGATAILLALTYLAATSPASAAGGSGESSLTVFPSKIEVAAKPGGHARRTITVVNTGAGTLRITPGLADYVIRPDNSFIFLRPGAMSYSSSKWTRLDKQAFKLSPGKSENIAATVSVPDNAEPGGHYSSAIFKIRSEVKENRGLKIVSAVAVQILTTVGDGTQIIRDGIVSGFTNKNGFFDREIHSAVSFKNRGNVHLSIRGRVFFYDLLGRRIGSAPLQPITVLPKTTRITKAKWSGPRIGLISSRAKVEYGTDLANYDTSKFSATQKFWILPWREGIAIVAVLIVLAIILRRGNGPKDPVAKRAQILRRSIRRVIRPTRKAA